MRFSLADYLQTVTPHLPPALVAPAVWQQIQSVARALPPAAMIGFESALASPEATADFAIGLTARTQSRELFAGHLSSVDARGSFAAPGWERFGAFAAAWADPGSPLYATMGTVWLEWDMQGSAPEIPAPNVLFGVQARDERQALMERGLQCLMGRPLSPPVRNQLQRCFEALPPWTNIFQVGAMLARQVDGLRVCVYPITVEQAGAYLAELDWRGDVEDAVRALAPFGRFATRMALAIDIGAGVGPRIGLECYMEEQRRPEANASWIGLLDELVAHGLCTPARRAALLGWPGVQQSSQFIWMRTFTRGLNHLKLVYRPGRSLEAKAYWGFVHQLSGATRASVPA